MEKKKTIWDYFDEQIEYPNNIVSNPIPYGEVWTYVSSTFLNGFINYVKPVKIFLIDRYVPNDEDITERNVSVKKPGTWNWEKFKGTKGELKTAIITGEYEMYHTNLHCFGDDVVILAELDDKETASDDEEKTYIFFWFDCDVSDCSIGKFKTTDTKEEVIQSVVNWLEQQKEENNKDLNFDKYFDNGVYNYTELPLSFIAGWVNF